MSLYNKINLITPEINLSGTDIINPMEGCMYIQKGDQLGCIILASTLSLTKDCSFCIQTSKGGLYLLNNSSLVYKCNKFLSPNKTYTFNIINDSANIWKLYNNDGYIDNNVIINWSEFFNKNVTGAPPLSARKYALFINGIYNILLNVSNANLFKEAVANETALALSNTLLPSVDTSSIYNSFPKLSNNNAIVSQVNSYLAANPIPSAALSPSYVLPPSDPKKWYGVNPVLPNWNSNNISYFANTFTTIPVGPSSTMQNDATDLLAMNRTNVTNEIAYHFANTPPPAHLISITCSMLTNKDLPITTLTQILSLVAIALSDAGLFAWTTKYTYWGARPFQYINGYSPLITTPNFPGYISGHSTFSAVWDQLLGMVVPSVRDMVKYIADLSGISRLYGGIHFADDNITGLNSGRSIGTSVYNALVTKINNPQPFL